MKQNEDMTTEAAIMQAAENEFLEKGFNGAKTTEIARRAGVTHAMLHYYFRTKENLFDQVFLEKLQIVANSFSMILGKDLPFLERIKLGIEAHFDYLLANPKLPAFIIHEIIADETRREVCKAVILPKFQEVLQRLKIAMQEEVAKGTIRFIEPWDLMMNIVSLNVFVFVATPLVKMIVNVDDENFGAFLEHRKQQNVELILKGLQV